MKSGCTDITIGPYTFVGGDQFIFLGTEDKLPEGYFPRVRMVRIAAASRSYFGLSSISSGLT